MNNYSPYMHKALSKCLKTFYHAINIHEMGISRQIFIVEVRK